MILLQVLNVAVEFILIDYPLIGGEKYGSVMLTVVS